LTLQIQLCDNFSPQDRIFGKMSTQMMELAIFAIGFAIGGVTVAAGHWLLPDEEDRTEDSIDTAVHR
jgi:hypothetical protein